MSHYSSRPPQLTPEPGSTVSRPARHTTPGPAPHRGHGTARGSARALALGLAAAMALSTTGCLGPTRPSPEDTAIALGSAISSLEFGAVPLTAAASAASRAVRDALPEQMLSDEARPTVTTDAVTVHEDDPGRATAEYTVRRDLASLGLEGQEWTYRTDAELVWAEDAGQWRVDLRPDDVVAGLAPGGTVTVERTAAQREDILDAAGEPLMTERDVVVLGLDKDRIEPDQVADSARQVAELAEVDAEAFVARAEAAGDRAFVEAITLRDGGPDTYPQQIWEVPGGRAVEDTAILAPTRTFAREVLGTYGEPSAEQVADSDGRLEPGVAVGLSGLQSSWQDHLAGTGGLTVRIDNPDSPGVSGAEDSGTENSGTGEPDGGAAPSAPASPEGAASLSPSGTATGGTSGAAPSSLPDVSAVQADPVAGADVASTLDRRIQSAAESVVDAAEVPAGLVAVRPSDGHVLAAASGPESAGWPVAVTGSFAPGSTYKVVTALALLRSGLTPDSPVPCPDTITVGGLQIGNYDGYPESSLGQIPLSEALAQSCNTSFVGAHEDVSSAQQAEAARALGLAAEPVTGLDSAFLAAVPEDSTGTEHAANLFGQGVVEASPLGMATVAASVAAGRTVRPVFVSDPAVQTEPAPAEGITAEEAQALRQMMAGTVTEGTATMLQDVPGAPVLAKTGTAQFVAEGEDLAHTWLIAIHGDLAVALFFNEGQGGGVDNGPVMRDFLTAVEEITPSA